MKLTLGYDPELMLIDNQRKKVVSAIPVLKRDKSDPIKLGEARLYWDNVLAEFSHPPSFSPEEAVLTFRKIFSDILEYLGPRYSLLAQASHVYDDEELKDPVCWQIGCNPNSDAYRAAINEPAKFTSGLRTGSFHVHLGHEKLDDIYKKADAIKLLDIYVGCAAVLFDKDPTALARRQYYGRAGEFRPTEYGCEWRVLGNYPLRSMELTSLVFDLVAFAATKIEDNTIKDILNLPNIQQRAQLAINTGDRSVAEKVLSVAGLPAKLMGRVTREYQVSDLATGWALA